MTDSLFENVAVPVASEDDARTTMHAVLPYLEDAGGIATVVFVVEKAGGAPDKASVEQREAYAREIFEIVRELASERGATIATEITYGTNVGKAIVEAANDAGANAIAFTSRGSSRWTKLLTGDVTRTLLNESNLPVIALPEATDD